MPISELPSNGQSNLCSQFAPSLFLLLLDDFHPHNRRSCGRGDGPEEKAAEATSASIQQICQFLSQTAFELRRRKGEIEDGRGRGDENKEEGAKSNGGGGGQRADELEEIGKKVQLLIGLKLGDYPLLAVWLSKMCHLMLLGGGHPHQQQEHSIDHFATFLDQLCLSLGSLSLPPICLPKPAFLLPKFPAAPSSANWKFHTIAEAAARIDIAGGWTDTPPITYQMGPMAVPAVLSLSIRVNGKLPIRCLCSRLENFQGIFYCEKSVGQQHKILHFPSASHVLANSKRPSQSGSLICAVLVIAGIVGEELVGSERRPFFQFGGPGRGLFVQTESDLPHGSGLGSSSILSGALLAALANLRGQTLTQTELIHSVLRAEQLHTTGGGWQDQMGGCLPGGLKLGWVEGDGQRECQWRRVPIGGALTEHQFGQRMMLIYTGKTRLAKTLLQEVLLNWARADSDILETVKKLADGARRAEQMFLQGEFPSEVCAEYNELKKRFAANTEPQIVTEFKRELAARGLAEVAWMAGAGGGGFLYVWLKKDKKPRDLEEMMAARGEWRGMSLWRVQLEQQSPLVVRNN